MNISVLDASLHTSNWGDITNPTLALFFGFDTNGFNNGNISIIDKIVSGCPVQT
jgi:hypothetical protein